MFLIENNNLNVGIFAFTIKLLTTTQFNSLMERSQILTFLRFFWKKANFPLLQHRKVMNLSGKFRRTETFTRTNYGNSDLQRYHRVHHENY